MAYATLDDLRAYLPQVEIAGLRDQELTAILERAHAVITDELGFEFAAWGSATDKDIYLERDSEVLRLPAHKAASVVSVKYVSERGTATESTEDVADWLEEDNGDLYRYAGWSAGWYRVNAVWGYGPAPASVIEVELEVAVNIWRSKDAASFGDAVGIEGQTITVNRALTWAQRAILDGIRRRYLGVVHA